MKYILQCYHIVEKIKDLFNILRPFFIVKDGKIVTREKLLRYDRKAITRKVELKGIIIHISKACTEEHGKVTCVSLR